jgi:peptide/nickel transport system ATP-binding protein
VMYAGRKVEEAPVEQLFADPRHPYTRGLLASVLRLDRPALAEGGGPLAEIRGTVPALADLPRGCAFAARCGLADARCRERRPDMVAVAPGHVVACWHGLEPFGAGHG